jgi:prepilin-type N-terminal cleavage/methylation domain-containing protein
MNKFYKIDFMNVKRQDSRYRIQDSGYTIHPPLSPLNKGGIKGGSRASCIVHRASCKGGFTLIELVIAMSIILFVSLGFFSWSSVIVGTNVSIERNNTAYAMALDVADRLQRMYDNELIYPRCTSGTTPCTSYNRKCVGFTTGGALRGCGTALTCGGADGPTVDIKYGETGMTTLTNPWGSSKLYLYDNNNCEGKSWVDPACGGPGSVFIQSTANTYIDHPNAAVEAVTGGYSEVNPIRFYRTTTYYAVWSVAYIPCDAGTNTDRRKIFITVYWIDPEPTETTVAPVQTGISGGTYTIKSVSLVIDKTIGAEVYTGS